MGGLGELLPDVVAEIAHRAWLVRDALKPAKTAHTKASSKRASATSASPSKRDRAQSKKGANSARRRR